MRFGTVLLLPSLFAGALATVYCGCSNSGISGVNQKQSDSCQVHDTSGATDACKMYQGKCLYPKYVSIAAPVLSNKTGSGSRLTLRLIVLYI